MRNWSHLMLGLLLCSCGPLGEEGGVASGSRPGSEDNAASPVSSNRNLIANSISEVNCSDKAFTLFRNGKENTSSDNSDCNYRDGSSTIDVNCSASDTNYKPQFMIHGEGSTATAGEQVIDAKFTISDWSALGLTPEETAECEAKITVGGGEFGKSAYKVLRTVGQIKRADGQYLFGFILGTLCPDIKNRRSDEIVGCFRK